MREKEPSMAVNDTRTLKLKRNYSVGIRHWVLCAHARARGHISVGWGCVRGKALSQLSMFRLCRKIDAAKIEE